MPEGPSIVILKEQVKAFKGKKVIAASGRGNFDYARLVNQKVVVFESWGKHFLICFKEFFLRIHLLLFGSFRINETRDAIPRLSLVFPNGELHFYASSIRLIEGNVNDFYDWSADVMNENWSSRKARNKLKKHPRMLVCDALLDQQLFSGVGNIIKNEVLYRIAVHPKSHVGALSPKKVTQLIAEARNYSFDFYEWKKNYVLRKHWLVYGKKKCRRCQTPLLKEYLGKTKRRTFFCNKCQELFELKNSRGGVDKSE